MSNRPVRFAGDLPLVHADPISGTLEAAVISGGATGFLLHFHWRDPSSGRCWVAQVPLALDDVREAVPAEDSLLTAAGRWRTLEAMGVKPK